jgi:hypothetical protein
VLGLLLAFLLSLLAGRWLYQLVELRPLPFGPQWLRRFYTR